MKLSLRNYDIILEQRLDFLKYLTPWMTKRVFILTDENVHHHYHSIMETLSDDIVVIPPNESSKSLFMYEKTVKELLKRGIQRADLIVSFGGGVIGDLGGFIASTILRGVDHIMIPTTLLSMVDSSIGGKTGINTEDGKNVIGTFYEPKKVLIDPQFLITLDQEELQSGLAEMIKMALIGNKQLFHSIAAKEQVTLADIYDAIIIKKRIVEADFKEQGIRAYLNFGHTFAHQIEKEKGFTIKHGHAVAYGMLYEMEIAIKLGLTPKHLYEELYHLLIQKKMIECPITPKEHYINNTIFDKKRQGDTLVFTILEDYEKPRLIHLAIEDLKR